MARQTPPTAASTCSVRWKADTDEGYHAKISPAQVELAFLETLHTAMEVLAKEPVLFSGLKSVNEIATTDPEQYDLAAGLAQEQVDDLVKVESRKQEKKNDKWFKCCKVVCDYKSEGMLAGILSPSRKKCSTKKPKYVGYHRDQD
eukprot:TRINITY_DN8615_c0_g1_i10.p2 TRINITY_DN8615_c0_g1~~TRINITY_DN8615_c0_g1_i10.p2  ORF type:complete len:145 (-),score=47.40 TRINITY_DN8615_c0_g1_i10:117-551(-)